MALPTTIEYTNIQINVDDRRAYLNGAQPGIPAGEPDFLYTIQRPVLVVNGTSLTNAIFLCASTLAERTLTFSRNDVILCNTSWALQGIKYPNDEGEVLLRTLFGEANVPYLMPYDFLGTFIIKTLFGVSEMAGKLQKYTYTTDTGAQFTIRMDVTNATAVQNTVANQSTIVNKPGALSLRYILLEQSDDPTVRRKIFITNSSLGLYQNGGTVSLQTVTGEKLFRVTGRVGEKYSF